MRVLLDTNIILDFFLEREPFFQEANAIFDAIVSEQVSGFITASSATDIFYICRKQTQNVAESREIITKVLSVLSICTVDRVSLETALNLDMADFEDAVQLACAIQSQLDAIITRNPQDFPTSTVQILLVNQLLPQL